jgi:hypothetical protein
MIGNSSDSSSSDTGPHERLSRFAPRRKTAGGSPCGLEHRLAEVGTALSLAKRSIDVTVHGPRPTT